MLEPVARAAAHEPDVVVGGVAVDDEIGVGRGLVLAHPRLDDRRVGHRRKPPSHVSTRQPDGLRVDLPLAVRGIERRAVAIRRELHAPTGDRGQAVHRGVVVDPAGEPLGVEPAVARWRAEEHHVLLGDPDELARDVRKEAWEPGPGREHERAARVAGAIAGNDVEEAPPVRGTRERPRELEPSAVPGERPGHGGHPVPCQQEACLRLVRGEREVIDRDLRPAIGEVGRG